MCSCLKLTLHNSHSQWIQCLTDPHVFIFDKLMQTRRVSGADQEHSLSKARVKHDQAWSPNRWVTIMCWALCPPWDFSRVKFCAHSAKVLWMRLNWGAPVCITIIMQKDYIHEKSFEMCISLFAYDLDLTVLRWLSLWLTGHSNPVTTTLCYTYTVTVLLLVQATMWFDYFHSPLPFDSSWCP